MGDTILGKVAGYTIDQAPALIRDPLRGLTETDIFKNAAGSVEEKITNAVNNPEGTLNKITNTAGSALEEVDSAWDSIASFIPEDYRDAAGLTLAATFSSAFLGPQLTLILGGAALAIKSFAEGNTQQGLAYFGSGIAASLAAGAVGNGAVAGGVGAATGFGIFEAIQKSFPDAFKQDELAGVDPRLAHVERTLT